MPDGEATELKDVNDPFTVLESFKIDDLKELEEEATSKERLIVAAVENRWQESRDNKLTRQQISDRNRLLLRGETMIGRTRNDSQVLRVVIEGDPRNIRGHSNKILPLHRAFTGKFTRAVPMVRAKPRTNDRDDMQASVIQDSWLDYIRLAKKTKVLYKRIVEAISADGTAFVFEFWNPDIGPAIAVCEQCEYASREANVGEPCPQCAQMLQQQQMQAAQMGQPPQPMDPSQIPILQEAREGDIDFKLIPFKDAYPDPGANCDPLSMQYFIIDEVMSVNELRKKFPGRAHLIQEEEGLFADRFIAMPRGVQGSRIESRALHHHARLKTYIEVPSGLHPNGRIIYVSNDRIMDVRECISARLLGRLPIFVFRGDVDPDSIYGLDIISQAEPQQRERDVLSTQLRRYRELSLNPRTLAETNSGLNTKFMSMTPGEIIKVKRIGAVRSLNPPALPSYIINDFQRLSSEMNEKFGVTEYELGGGDTSSGRFAAFLETQASETVGPLSIEIEEEFLELHRGSLILGKYYYSPDRVWTVTSRGRVFSRSWGEANILPGWDVYLATQDALSRNPVLRLQQSRELLREGYYTDAMTGQIDWDMFRVDAGLNVDRAGTDSEATAHMYAAEIPKMVEDALLKQDPRLMPQPKPWDNAKIMASELLDWLRGPGVTAPEPVQRHVAQLWLLYAMSLAPQPGQPMDPKTAEVMPNQQLLGVWQQSQQPQQQPAGPGPGGSRPGQQLGMPQQTGTPSAGQETAAKVQQADRTAEAAARPTGRHEG